MPKTRKIFSLTDKEMQIMKILWKSPEPLVASEITKMDMSLNKNTVQAVIRKLLSKNFIKVADIVYSGTVLTRSYAPALSEKELMVQQFVDQVQENEENIPIPNLVATLLKHEKNEEKIIKELELLLEERKKTLKSEE
ncbi:MAG: BlaI/MecI/CopY family transcriptional regulator [Clostridiales bacterium]|jgi:predicted transcriptional regulator|nr:BlaI/MecI/CopY family transcriptional regulator [Clostridiales bacterium]